MDRGTNIVFEGRGLTKRYGHVTALDGTDFELRAGEVMAVIGDNGAGKSTLIKVLSGAVRPDEGTLLLDGRPTTFRGPAEARRQGIETVYQELAVAPPLDITANLFLGRETLRPGPLGRFLGMLDKPAMRARTIEHMQALRFNIPSIGSAVEVLSGGQRQGVAVARAGAFGRKLVIMDEPTAALGVRESGQVLDLIRTIRDRGLPVVLISHNMPHVFEIADRIHIQRLGRRIALIRPQDHAMAEAVAIMTGAAVAPEVAAA